MAALPDVGKIYRVHHSRKGRATVRIETISDDEIWIDAVIIEGTLSGIGAGSVRMEGDAVRMRASLCKFEACDD